MTLVTPHSQDFSVKKAKNQLKIMLDSTSEYKNFIKIDQITEQNGVVDIVSQKIVKCLRLEFEEKPF